MNRISRTALAGVPQLVALMPAAVLAITARDRLPTEVAGRFAVSGAAVSTLSRGTLLATTLALGVLLALTFGLVAARAPGEAAVSRSDTARFFGALSWATAGFLGTVLYAAVLANVDITDAAAARLPLTRLLLALGIAAVTGAVGYLVTPPTPPARPAPDAAPLPIGRGERVSWTHRTSSRASQVVAVVLVGGLLLAGSPGRSPRSCSSSSGSRCCCWAAARR